MSKAKKTKQQKIITDLNRKLQAQSPHAHSSSHQTSARPSIYTYTAKTSHVTQAPTKVVDLSYVKHDLVKTTLVTSTIILSQLLLFYLLTSHIIRIPLVHY